MLIQTTAGVTPEYQEEFGTGSRLAKVTPENGVGTVVTDVFLDPQSCLEADVRLARWTGRQPARVVRIHPDLALQINEPVLEHEYLQPDRWSDEAEEILVKTLNRAIQLTQDHASIAHLMPEVLASLVPVANSPEVWGRQSEWLLGLAKTVGDLAMAGHLPGGVAESWQLYVAAIATIRQGKPELIGPIGAAWA
jgi:hypothetical protein